jgi:hypothetical protein
MLEILVAMAAAAMVLVGSVSSYMFLSQTYSKHKQFTKTHRKLRGPIALATSDIQSSGRAGLQPKAVGNYGIQDIRRRALDGSFDPTGWPSLTYTALTTDTNGNGRIEDDDGPPFTITWRLYDQDADGVMDLGREETDGNGTTTMMLVARNVENIGFAYAIDIDRDGALETNAIVGPPPTTATQWCVDTDDDNLLDAHLDNNLDGRISEHDDAEYGTVEGFGLIEAVPLAGAVTVPLTRIRQVAMYILVRNEFPEKNYVNKNYYVVGQTVWHPLDESDALSRYRRQVISIGITLRNREEELAI